MWNKENWARLDRKCLRTKLAFHESVKINIGMNPRENYDKILTTLEQLLQLDRRLLQRVELKVNTFSIRSQFRPFNGLPQNGMPKHMSLAIIDQFLETFGTDRVFKSISFTDKAYFGNSIHLKTETFASLCRMTEKLDLSGPFLLVECNKTLPKAKKQSIVKYLHIRGAYE